MFHTRVSQWTKPWSKNIRHGEVFVFSIRAPFFCIGVKITWLSVIIQYLCLCNWCVFMESYLLSIRTHLNYVNSTITSTTLHWLVSILNRAPQSITIIHPLLILTCHVITFTVADLHCAQPIFLRKTLTKNNFGCQKNYSTNEDEVLMG